MENEVLVSNICIMTPDKKRTKCPGSTETSAQPDTGVTSLTVTHELKGDKFTSIVTCFALVPC